MSTTAESMQEFDRLVKYFKKTARTMQAMAKHIEKYDANQYLQAQTDINNALSALRAQASKVTTRLTEDTRGAISTAPLMYMHPRLAHMAPRTRLYPGYHPHTTQGQCTCNTCIERRG